MAEKSFKSYIISVILVSLFIVCIYNWGQSVGSTYSVDLNVSDKQLDLTGVKGSLTTGQNRSNGLETTFNDGSKVIDAGLLVVPSIWGVLKNMWTSLSSSMNLFLGGLVNVLGIDPIVTGVIILILTISIILAIWRLTRVGE